MTGLGAVDPDRLRIIDLDRENREFCCIGGYGHEARLEHACCVWSGLKKRCAWFSEAGLSDCMVLREAIVSA